MQIPKIELATLTRPFMPWLIPSAAGILFPVLIISLNFLFSNHTDFKFLEINYGSHFFNIAPLADTPGMDATIILGTKWLFWGIGILLFFKFFPDIHPDRTWNQIASNLCNHVTAGLISIYIVSLFNLWLLAAYEGYIDDIFKYPGSNHGPWHFISHLRVFVFIIIRPLGLSLMLTPIALLLKPNIKSFLILIFAIGLFLFHIYSHLWLID